MRGKFSPLLILAVIVAITPNNMQGAPAAMPAVINVSGENLECIFQGLKPDPAFLMARGAPLQRLRKSWNGIDVSPLPGFRPIQITEGGSCPTSVCSGSYDSVVPSYGCMFEYCAAQNAVYDPNAGCNAGTRDEECGDGTICCANAEMCWNVNNVC